MQCLIKAVLKKYDGAIYPIIKNEGIYNNKPVEIYGFKPTTIYEENWPLLESTENAWERIRNGEIIFVSEQLSIREKIKQGDFLELELDNKKLYVQVGGTYADYGNSRNQLMMQFKLYKTFFSSRHTSNHFTCVLPGTQNFKYTSNCACACMFWSSDVVTSILPHILKCTRCSL